MTLKLNKLLNNPNKTTYSGYSKQETYALLLQSMLAKDIHSCCYVSAELLCTKTELNALIVYIIDIVCKHYHSYNIYNICALVTKLETLSSLSRRNIQRNPHAQQYMCEIVILLTIKIIKDKDFHHEYIERYTNSTLIYLSMESELYEVKLLTDINHWVHTLFKDFPFEIQRYLHILYKFIKNKDKKQVIEYANYLLMNTEIQGLISQYQIDYEFDINTYKNDKNDIAIILWKFILQYLDHKMSDEYKIVLKPYMLNLYFLYAFNYTKNKRSLRIMMIYNALLCIMTPILFTNKSSEKTLAIIEEAKSKAYIIYDEIIGPLVVNNKKLVSPVSIMSSVLPVLIQASNEKDLPKVYNHMDYLKMCTWGSDE